MENILENNQDFIEYKQYKQFKTLLGIFYTSLCWFGAINFLNIRKISIFNLFIGILLVTLTFVHIKLFQMYFLSIPYLTTSTITDKKKEKKSKKEASIRYKIMLYEKEYWLNSVSTKELSIGEEVIIFFYDFGKAYILRK